MARLVASGLAMPGTLVTRVRRTVAWTAEALVPGVEGSPFAPGAGPVSGTADSPDGRPPGAGAAVDRPADDASGEPAPPDPMAAWSIGSGPAIHRILRGNLALLDLIVADVAGSDPAARQRWQRQLEALLEAILERALNKGLVDPPAAHPFWGAFSREQGRQLLEALASIGYHFDGLGGWMNGRVPGRRDLSLAMEYARVDPVRLRAWPAAEEMERLLADVTIAGGEYLEEVAPDLALAELASAMGRQSLRLAELWLLWERVRPLLLAEGPKDGRGQDDRSRPGRGTDARQPGPDAGGPGPASGVSGSASGDPGPDDRGPDDRGPDDRGPDDDGPGPAANGPGANGPGANGPSSAVNGPGRRPLGAAAPR